MVTAKHRLSLIAAVVGTVALGWCAPGLAQTTAPAPAPPAAPAAPAPQPAAPAAPAHKHMAHHRMAHRQFVESVQTALNGAGAKLTVDGRWGPKTSAALREFQQQHNLKVTGRPDKETIDALGIHR